MAHIQVQDWVPISHPHFGNQYGETWRCQRQRGIPCIVHRNPFSQKVKGMKRLSLREGSCKPSPDILVQTRGLNSMMCSHLAIRGFVYTVLFWLVTCPFKYYIILFWRVKHMLRMSRTNEILYMVDTRGSAILTSIKNSHYNESNTLEHC